MMLDARRLHMLSELERLGTIAAVADAMHVTPPGVSMQLSALERELGLQLTERRGRGLVLTPAGRVVASHGRVLGEQLSLAEHEIDAVRDGTAGHYRVSAFPTAARAIMADVWADLLLANGTTIDLATAEPEEALQALLAGSIDVAIVHSYSNVPRQMPDTVHVTALGIEPVKLAVPTGEQHDSTIDLRTCTGRTWITPSRQRTCFDMVERACGLAGFRPNVVAETDDFDVQLALVRAGVGVALIPQLALDRPLEGVTVLEPEATIERHLYVATRAELRDDPGLVRLTDALRTATVVHIGKRHAGLDPRQRHHATTHVAAQRVQYRPVARGGDAR
jgi:DNA-binding transcriptional LysR family regulator